MRTAYTKQLTHQRANRDYNSAPTRRKIGAQLIECSNRAFASEQFVVRLSAARSIRSARQNATSRL